MAIDIGIVSTYDIEELDTLVDENIVELSTNGYEAIDFKYSTCYDIGREAIQYSVLVVYRKAE